MTTTVEVLPLPVTFEGSDVLRRAVAGYLARYKGLSRSHTESDLRVFLGWCTERGLDPLAAAHRALRPLDAGGTPVQAPPPCPDESRSTRETPRSFTGRWQCRDAAGSTVDCVGGALRVAVFTPDVAFPAGSYSVSFNPEHVLAVTDLAGNPYFGPVTTSLPGPTSRNAVTGLIATQPASLRPRRAVSRTTNRRTIGTRHRTPTQTVRALLPMPR